ncbi:MAG: FAD-dependent oxidoreductase [Acidaminococcaceae bacterium]|nr:FAD-dependent oxidoreductase [Acidaminococcaceae bacterium]
MIYDIIIVGGGPSGLTAAIYAARAGRTVLVLEKESFGGQRVYSPMVDNYPACPHISGADLANKMVTQAMDAGAECMSAEVTGIFHAESETFTIQTDMGNYESKALILATGARHRELGLPNEKDLVGNGVSYCAVCDGAFYNDKKVIVIGGGNSALTTALFLADRCKEVTVVHCLQNFQAENTLVEYAKAKANINLVLNKKANRFCDNNGVLESIDFVDNESGKLENFVTDGVFVCIGQQPQSDPFALLGITDDLGYYDADETTITHISGLFVAGDGRAKNIRQLTTAVADGATAGLAASEYTAK